MIHVMCDYVIEYTISFVYQSSDTKHWFATSRYSPLWLSCLNTHLCTKSNLFYFNFLEPYFSAWLYYFAWCTDAALSHTMIQSISKLLFAVNIKNQKIILYNTSISPARALRLPIVPRHAPKCYLFLLSWTPAHKLQTFLYGISALLGVL